MKIKYLDKEGIWRALRRYIADLEENNPEVKRVILFGSFAEGTSLPSSDVDLLLVLDESGHPFLERITKYMPSRFPVGVDVFPYTEKELGAMMSEGNFFIREALEKGRDILDRRGRQR